MENINKLTEQFKSLYERFLIGCDSIEEMGEWNIEEYGDMDVFYSNDLIGVILRLIVSDGIISDKEVNYLNKTFDFDYSIEELKDVYENCKEELQDTYDDNFSSGLIIMKSINLKLAEAYKELLRLICEIIIQSDDIVSSEEMNVINELKLTLS